MLLGTLIDPTYSIASGQLPPGITLDPSTGTVSGSTTVAGSFTVGILVTGGVGPNGVPRSTLGALQLEVLFLPVAVPLSPPGLDCSDLRLGFFGDPPDEAATPAALSLRREEKNLDSSSRYPPKYVRYLFCSATELCLGHSFEDLRSRTWRRTLASSWWRGWSIRLLIVIKLSRSIQKALTSP